MVPGLKMILLTTVLAGVPTTATAAVWEWNWEPELSGLLPELGRLSPELVGAGMLGVAALGVLGLVLRGGRRQRPHEPAPSPREPSLNRPSPDAAELSQRLSRELGILSGAIGRLAESLAGAPRPESGEQPDIGALLSGVTGQVVQAHRLLAEKRDAATDEGAWLARAEEAIGGLEALAEEATGLDALLTTLCELSDRTQLLAINAAIEAAKAGESGRGLARVADDVRLMARDSRHSARKLEGIMDRAVHSTRDLREVIASGAALYRSTLVFERRKARQAGEAAHLLTGAESDLAKLAEDLQRNSGGRGAGAPLMGHELARVLGELHGAAQQLSDISVRLSDSLQRPQG